MPLCRLLTKVYDCGFAMVVIAIHAMDMLTIPYLLVDDEKGGDECDNDDHQQDGHNEAVKVDN